MYYDKELSMIQNYADEILSDISARGRSMTRLEFKKASARYWAVNEILNTIAQEDGAINALAPGDAPYSAAMLTQCFMIDMQYCIHICRNVETTLVWQNAYEVGREVLERLKALP